MVSQRANITHFVRNMDLPSEDSDAERHYRKGAKHVPADDDGAWDTKSQAMSRTLPTNPFALPVAHVFLMLLIVSRTK